ncbi:hypothetical protein SERLA73DRAFT_182846 [Serpula lacrymans var. lacrymans S7.3]|uniref:Pyruvate decarboxylase n=1 Tax=Serpula lacrymans var. lacrymans (strain S7.3) TaxID=936435 RepID=F8Q133_SERL3|nr:hypothetical protein SERLA73DRAFT_182846 [Serpula lacrymans var. lacrymans S7.3]
MTDTAANNLQAEVNRLRHELQSLKVDKQSDDGEQVTIAEYLLARLEQLGVTSIFGVPGDFNMPFLDYIEDHPKIDWIGNCNELNAAYAADGYARVKENSIGVVTTTFGVGELSAMNGVAGAFSEMVPVLHIVGAPSTAQQKKKPMLHHTLGDGRFGAYIKASEQITIAQAVLMSKTNATSEIDRILTECITRARPVYLMLPTDLVSQKVPAGRLEVPLSRTPPPNNPDVEKFVLDEIVKLVDSADQDIIILVDACAIRHNVRQEVDDLLTRTQFPVYAAPMGKTAVSENHNRYGGIYIGSISDPSIKEKVENAKLILSIGALKSDFNTGMFTYSIPTSSTIELHSDHTQVQHAQFPGIGMKQLLPKLTARLKQFESSASQLAVPHYKAVIPNEQHDDISHAWFWPRMGAFFKEGDVIVAETGTSSFGILDIPLPERSVFVSQILYGSIGWSVGSTLGAALAARDKKMGRTILFVGDGSLQLTVQELSTMMHYGLKPIIFVLNNKGYNIERHLHGMHRKYNDIADWQWTSLLTTLSNPNPQEKPKSKSYTLTALLEDKIFSNTGEMQLVEVVMDMYDTPRALQAAADLSAS